MGLGFSNPVGTRGVWDVCVFWIAVVYVVLGSVSRCLGPETGRVVRCYVCVCCEPGFFVKMAAPGICVLCSADTCTS